MNPAPIIRAETPQDIPAILQVHLDAFEADASIQTLIGELRTHKADLKTLSFVAERQDQIIGHVMLSHSWLDAPKQIIDVYVLSPLGVRTAFQRSGVGKALISYALSAAEGAGVPLVFLEGNPKYYAPRGFEKGADFGFRRPSLRIPEPAFQVYKLNQYDPQDMTGTLVYNSVFWQNDCVGLRK